MSDVDDSEWDADEILFSCGVCGGMFPLDFEGCDEGVCDDCCLDMYSPEQGEL